MSVALYRYDKKIEDVDAQLIYSENIASESFYFKFWTKAIIETNTQIFKDGAEFKVSDLSVVLFELNSLKKWAINNLIGDDLLYMKKRIENLEFNLPVECEKKGGNFYIF